MRKLLFIVPLIIIVFFSCNHDNNEERIKSLQDSLNYFQKKYMEKDSLYDSIYSQYWELREKVTKHMKYYYTVYEDVIRDEDGTEYTIQEFLSDLYENDGMQDYILITDLTTRYSKSDIIDLFDISSLDFEDEDDYENDYDVDYDTHGRIND